MQTSIISKKPKDLLKSKGVVFKTILILSLFFISTFGTINDISVYKNDGNDCLQDFDTESLSVAADGIDNLVFSDDFNDGNYDGWYLVNETWNADSGYLRSIGRAYMDGGRLIDSPSEIRKDLDMQIPINNITFDFDFRFELPLFSGNHEQIIYINFFINGWGYLSLLIINDGANGENNCFQLKRYAAGHYNFYCQSSPYEPDDQWHSVNVAIMNNKISVLYDGVIKINQWELPDTESRCLEAISVELSGRDDCLCDTYRNVDNILLKTSMNIQQNIPNAPYLNAIASPSTTGNITLSWGSVLGATSYKIYRSNLPITSVTGLQPIKSGHTLLSYADVGLTNGTYYYVVVATNGSGDSEISNCRSVTVGIPENMIINAESSLSYAFDALETDVIMNASYIKPTPHNNRVLDSWNIVPDEGYIRFFAYMAELKNIRACLTELGLPSCFINFLDLIISEDDSIRLLYNVNVLARESNKSFQDGILDLKSTFDFLMLFYTNPKDSKTIPELIKNNFKDPSVKKWFKMTTGPKGNDILKLKEGIDPIDAVVSFINVFYRIDISLLTYRNGEVIPITIRSNELISSVQFIFNILKLVGKVAALAATGFTNPLGWVQTIATAYVIVHQLIFDPPWIVRTILNFIYTNLTEHINNIFAQFEGVASWVYVAANFLDPPAARLDLALYNQQGNMLLGYDKASNSSVQNSSAGFVFGDQNAQFMVLYEDPGTKYDLKVTNTELEGEGQTELDYQLVVYQPNSTQSNIFEGYLDLGEETSTSIVLPEKGQQFTIPQLNISILKNEYPVFEIQILDENGNPVEVDSIKLYLANVELKFDYKYLGNGKYRLSNFALQENEQLIYQIVFIKAGYLMSSIHSSLFEAATNPVLVGILIGIAIVSLMAVVVVVVKKTKRKEKNKKLHSLLDQLK